MALNPTEIKQILDALAESDWDEAHVTVDGVSIAVSRGGPLSTAVTPFTPPGVGNGTPARPEAQPPTVTTAPDPRSGTPGSPTENVHLITAPSVGVFWRSPRPGSPPFVEVGSQIAVGDTVCIVEMMKLMNNVVADVAGTVVGVHVENAGQVEYGTALISIAPAESR